MTDARGSERGAGGLDCRKAMAVLWDYLDGELDAERTAAVRAHLETCKPCLAHHDFERAFLIALAAARCTDAAPTALPRRVTVALQEQRLLR